MNSFASISTLTNVNTGHSDENLIEARPFYLSCYEVIPSHSFTFPLQVKFKSLASELQEIGSRKMIRGDKISPHIKLSDIEV